MEATLHALGEILLRAIPTFILVILLHLYLKYVFLGPMRAMLSKRYEAGEGAKRAAEMMMGRAEQKTAEYEARLAQVRQELYREQEQERSRFRAEQEEQLEAARKRTAELVAAAQQQLNEDSLRARYELRAESEALAEQIASAILGRK